MKKFALLLTAAFTMTLILDSCSVQKRYHRKGFTVNWNHASVKMKKNQKAIHSESIQEDAIVSHSKKKEKLAESYTAPKANDLANKEIALPSAIDAPVISPVEKIREHKASNNAAPAKEFSKKDVKSTKKAAKKIIKSIKKNQEKDSKTDTIIYLLLILLVPFGTTIAMYLYEGSWTSRVTVNLILSFLCIAGLIHSLVIIFGKK